MNEPNPNPPGLAERFLGRVLPSDPAGRSILGDFREEFVRRAKASPSAARRWYWKESLGVAYRRSLDRVLGRSRSPRIHRTSRQGDAMLFRMLSDVRFAFRTLRRSRGFTTAAVLTLALGIGANTAIFSVVNGILIRPLPFPDAEELVGVWHTAPGLGYPQFGSSPGLFFLYQEQSDAFASMGLINTTSLSVAGDGEPERVDGGITTRGLFDVLSVAPIRGRIFSEQETMPDGPRTALISEGFWRRRFAGDPGVLGRTIQVGGVTREIIGVMPEVRLPRDPIELWVPMEVDPAQAQPGAFGPRLVARLSPGATVEQAKQQLDQLIADRVPEQFSNPQFLAFVNAGELATIVNPYKEDVVGDLREPLWILLGTVGFVLLIACANVANLFLVRAEARRREMAVRNALGASRGVLVRQYLTESWVLAGLGGGAGLLLAWGGVPLLLRAAPPELPRLNDVRMDLSVLGFAVLASALSAVLFGLIPAIRNSSSDLLSALKIAGRGSSSGRDRHLFRSSLVIGQTAMALVLLVGSGLLVKSFWELRRVHPGFDAQDVVTFGLNLPQSRYETPSDVAAFHMGLLERLRGLPGVISAGAAANIPFAGNAAGTAFDIEDQPTTQSELPPIVWFTFAAPQYFETMRIPVVSGRTFEPRDHEQGAGTTIVSQALAERLWPGEDAVGKQLRFSGDSTGWDRVVGVVGSVRDQGLRQDPSELIYHPMMDRQLNEGRSVRAMGYVVRARNPEALMNSIRATVWELDSELPITSVGTIEGLMEDSIVQLSFTTITLVIAAIMAVALGAIGLYGVLAYLVAQRRQEIGVRIALGAQVAEVRRMVVKQGARLAIMGLGVGLVGAFGLTRFLDALLFGTAPLDPIAFAATSVALLGVVMLASYLPARRASSVDPVEALRNE